MNKKRSVISYFNRIAEPRQYFASGWITVRAKRNAYNIVSNLLTEIMNSHEKKALDVGCGVGGYFDILLETNYTVVGSDIAENMIKMSSSKYAGEDRIALLLADIEFLPFQQNSFDTIICIDTLQYLGLRVLESALMELIRVLKREKSIVIEIKNKACPAFWFRKYRDSRSETYSISSVTSMLKNSGCIIEVIKGTFGPAALSPIVVIKARKVIG